MMKPTILSWQSSKWNPTGPPPMIWRSNHKSIGRNLTIIAQKSQAAPPFGAAQKQMNVGRLLLIGWAGEGIRRVDNDNYRIRRTRRATVNHGIINIDHRRPYVRIHN